MKVFVTGANGWIGSHTIPILLDHGHSIIALVRSESSASKFPKSDKIEVVIGTTQDSALLTSSASKADAVLHLAYNHDFGGTSREQASKEDEDAIDAIAEGLKGTEKVFAIASGTAIGGGLKADAPGSASKTDKPLSEDTDFSGAGGRANASMKLSELSNSKGLTTIAIRYAPTVHGQGDHGFIQIFMNAFKSAGKAIYVGEGTNRWCAIQVDDAALLTVLALEQAEKGKFTVVHAIGESEIVFKDIVEEMGNKLDMKDESVDMKKAGEMVGPLSYFMSVDIPATSEITQKRFGWKPKGNGLLKDIALYYK